MQMLAIAAAGLAALGLAASTQRPAFADETRMSGPHVHENIAVYFIHGPSAAGPVPLTLQEALEKGSVQVLETGEVNELKIENTGNEDIFIQSGDIVKGGRQDRVLSMSFVLPPKSGQVSLAAFCVEHGRWSARGAEEAASFASAAEVMPSREAKLAMKAPRPASPEAQPSAEAYQGDDTSLRQQDVWTSVASTQNRLSAGINAAVASPQSSTSLQLSLENEKLQKARAEYVGALQKLGEEKEDIIGYVFAVNGKLNSADVYPSNALFRKMWPKLLAASVTEAIGQRDGGARADAPSVDAVGQFLETAEKGSAHAETVNNLTQQETRDTDASLFIEARRNDGEWVHRNYLAK